VRFPLAAYHDWPAAMCATVCTMDRSVAIGIPVEFTAGVRCAAGATRQLPVTLRTSGVRACTITVRSEGEAIDPIRRDVTLEPNGGQVQVVLELIARKVTEGHYWVTVNAICDDALSHMAGFDLEIVP
jgi:hypothetical protein